MSRGGLAVARDATTVDFVKLSPTRNTTVLVTSAHDVADYPSIAAQLLSAGHVHAEQVGFVRRPTTQAAQVRLHMAGEEFCGNACMAVAVLTAAGQGLPLAGHTCVDVEASGAESVLRCRVERLDSEYACELSLPSPGRVEDYAFPGLAPGRSVLVRQHDAVHVVVECDTAGQPLGDSSLRAQATRVAVRLAASERVPVVGVMLYDPARRELVPLVHVPTVGSLVWEHSCGSGTAALGAYLACTSGGPVDTDVHQPGGTMRVRADHTAAGVRDLRIQGRVSIVAEGRAYLHD